MKNKNNEKLSLYESPKAISHKICNRACIAVSLSGLNEGYGEGTNGSNEDYTEQDGVW